MSHITTTTQTIASLIDTQQVVTSEMKRILDAFGPDQPVAVTRKHTDRFGTFVIGIEPDLDSQDEQDDTDYDDNGPTGHGDICHSDADPGL